MSSVSDSLDEQLSPPSFSDGGRELRERIRELGEWFHNLNLHGVPTAPHHFLGDFPNIKWRQIAHAIPENLSGATVLDVGCNAGFYSIELKKRGARRVVGIDVDDRYLKQARFAAAVLGVDIELEKCSVYQVDRIAGGFDYVFFMGVFYHLRYPLFALDRLIKKVGGKLVFQTMVRGSQEADRWEDDYPFSNTEIFEQRNFPAMYFIEKSYSNDPTNWWIPNRSAVEAMLRSSGLEIEAHPEPETWICRPVAALRDGQYILDRELEGSL
ncbi:MAG: TIGR04290 family methyltransferase [Acidobacteria bacterium]|nr:TIGR04290 family methyltransferase [Acidobacteriota bacterium]